MNSFSIIIPAYNESKNLKPLIEEIYQSLSKKYNFELIIVNDGSSDDSIFLLNELKKTYSFIIVEHKKNYGQSRSILSGIKRSNYETIVTIDGDGQNNPIDIPNLLNKYASSKEILLVGGIRNKRMDSKIKIFSSKIANLIRSFILNDDCLDTGCSLKVFNKRAFLNFSYFDGIHRFLPALFKGYGFKTYFLPVNHRSRTKGVSKYGTFDRLFKGIYDLIKVKLIISKYKKTIKND